MKVTRVFKSGNSLAVRIPKEYRVRERELCIAKVGSKLILFPPDKKWDVLFEELERAKELTKDFLKERNQPPVQDRGDLF